LSLPETDIIWIVLVGQRVFENRVLRRIFGPRRDEVMGGWTKLLNEELSGLYALPSIIKMI
jgi:hypothetical protein